MTNAFLLNLNNVIYNVLLPLVVDVVGFLGLILPVLLAIAYFTLAERKLMSAVQRRQGPNVVGVFGLFQPLADGLKLLLKEAILPSTSDRPLFILAPRILFSVMLLGWVVIPFGHSMVYADLPLGILYRVAVSSISVYGIIIAGWSSNSVYALLGAMRSAAPLFSYEISMGVSLVTVLVCAGSSNLTTIVQSQENIWYMFPLLPSFALFFISSVAETGRHPFDLPEAEAELVSGYNVEYSGMGFALFFLGETGNMILMASYSTVLFLGGWLSPLASLIPVSQLNLSYGSFAGLIRNDHPILAWAYWLSEPLWFGLKTLLVIIVFVYIRVAFPRYRYDQLMRLGWKVLLPFSFGWMLFVVSFLMAFDGLVTA